MRSLHGPASADPRVVARWLMQGVRNRLPPRVLAVWQHLEPRPWVMERRFAAWFGRPIDWRQPVTFNEKIHWLMRYDRRPFLTRCADKVAVREVVAERVGPQVLNECYGIWDRAEAVPFAELPPTFVLKANWGSGFNLFCRDRSTLDVAAARDTLRGWFRGRRQYNRRLCEWAYKNIPPRVLAERFMTGPEGEMPNDYKIFCFNGEPRFIQVDTSRFTSHARDCFGLTWEPLPFRYHYQSSGREIPRPVNLDEMLTMARTLASGCPFVRVDFYSIEGRTIFGEMTWYPEGGMGRFDPPSWDRAWGDALELPAPRALLRRVLSG